MEIAASLARDKFTMSLIEPPRRTRQISSHLESGSIVATTRRPSCLDLRGINVRQATSSAFKGIKVGQVPKPRRCSSEPHSLRAAWAKRRPWRVFTRVFVAHGRSGPYPHVVRRQSGGSSSAPVALPPLAHPMLELSGGRRAGGTSRTHCILTETLRQRGNHDVTNRRFWYQICIFGDDQHMGDWPRGHTRSSSCETVNSSFTWESMPSSRRL